MNKRTKWLLGIGVIAALMFGWQVAAFATHASCISHSFECDDGNTPENDADDWDGPLPNPQPVVQNDQVNPDASDQALKGSEDSNPPGVVTGSIPPNKNDLSQMGVYQNKGTDGHDYLYLYWKRTATLGTANIDFELNQLRTKSSNNLTPVRTAGDVLVTYDFGSAGGDLQLGLLRWLTSGPDSACQANNGSTAAGCWGNFKDLDVSGDGDGAFSADGKFGEAAVDLTDTVFTGNQCVGLGAAFTKTRSSDSFTAALKDVTTPVNVNISNCGKVVINKVTAPSPDLTDTTFNYTTTGGSPLAAFTLKNGGSKDFSSSVPQGSYTVTETSPAPLFALTGLNCSASVTTNGTTITPDLATGTVSFNLKPGDTVNCTYTNTLQQGALRILKNSTKGGAVANAGAVFSYSGPGAANGSVTDNGTGDLDSDIGEVCVAGLQTGDFTVNETSPPNGYSGASQSNQTATVVSGTNCGANPPTGSAVVTFTNVPLSDIQVNFKDGGSGETSATSITCDNTTGTGSNTAATGWDASRTVTGVQIDPSPKTVICTIVIDP